MGLFSKIFLGVDLDEEQKRSDQADSSLEKLNKDALDRGIWSQETYEAAQQHIEAGRIDAQGEVSHAFIEGAKEGMANMTGAVNSTLSWGVGSIFKAIPLSIWLIAAAVLFVWMGGLVWLRGRMAQ